MSEEFIAYCTDCHKEIHEGDELHFVHFRNKVSTVLCEECFSDLANSETRKALEYDNDKT